MISNHFHLFFVTVKTSLTAGKNNCLRIKNGKYGFSEAVDISTSLLPVFGRLCLSLGLSLSLCLVLIRSICFFLSVAIVTTYLLFHPEIIIGKYLAFCAAAKRKRRRGNVHRSHHDLYSCAEYFRARDNNFNPISATYIFIVILFSFLFIDACLPSLLFRSFFRSRVAHGLFSIEFFVSIVFFFFLFKAAHKNCRADAKKIKNKMIFIQARLSSFRAKMTN